MNLDKKPCSRRSRIFNTTIDYMELGTLSVCFFFFKQSFSAFPALNFGTVTGGICIFSLGFWGLTPVRPARVFALNAPKPAIVTEPSCCSVVMTVSTNAASISSASLFETPTFSAMRSASAALFILFIQVKLLQTILIVYNKDYLCQQSGFEVFYVCKVAKVFKVYCFEGTWQIKKLS